MSSKFNPRFDNISLSLDLSHLNKVALSEIFDIYVSQPKSPCSPGILPVARESKLGPVEEGKTEHPTFQKCSNRNVFLFSLFKKFIPNPSAKKNIKCCCCKIVVEILFNSADKSVFI